MASIVPVTIQDLGGNLLQQDAAPSDTVEQLMELISTEWALDKRSFRLLAGTMVLKKDTQMQSVAPADGSPLEMQLLKFDPLLELGQFDATGHKGIKVCRADDEGNSKLVKTDLGRSPDSNNVFLRHPIQEPCFADFRVDYASDEVSIGVTYEMERVKEVSGFGNMHLMSTWLYSKKKAMPVLFFGGERFNPEGVSGICQGDVITVFVNPEERLVKFYRNGKLEASNLPEHPLPCHSGRPLWMYAMVDAPGDEITIIRFGPGEPFE